MKMLAGFVAGWLSALFFAAGWAGDAIDSVKAGKVFNCETVGGFWSSKKYLCTEAEFISNVISRRSQQ